MTDLQVKILINSAYHFYQYPFMSQKVYSTAKFQEISREGIFRIRLKKIQNLVNFEITFTTNFVYF